LHFNQFKIKKFRAKFLFKKNPLKKYIGLKPSRLHSLKHISLKKLYRKFDDNLAENS